jgi:hypothetical protein
MKRIGSLVAAWCIALTAAHANEIPAFPEAEGAGTDTPGGRGGEVYLVTTLNDSGEGSLRDACEAEGPRMVVVNVDGIIQLESPIRIANPFITIAGQAAPGGGICLTNHGLSITADDVVVRYLRIREVEDTAIEIQTAQRVVIDHCSVSWSKGPAVAVRGGQGGITLQWNLFAETLHNPERPTVGINIAGDEGTYSVHHNYFAHHYAGSPYFSGGNAAPGPTLDLRYNVVYDYGNIAGDSGGGPAQYNLIGNIYKMGPSTEYDLRAKGFRFNSMDASIYASNNTLVDSPMVSNNNFLLLRMPDDFILRRHFEMLRPGSPFPAPPVTESTQETTERRVLTEAGASKPKRDSADARIAAQFRLGGGRLIADPAEIGEWPEYESGEPIADADRDGMPDEWETQFGLSPSDPDDSRGDADEDGYTNIEEYLNSTRPAAGN